ncbi:CBS domain-containing protein [Phormidesmis priestleyi ULC007]|uniref:CBS domain-containing protein n=1 Tax=Phormidesmis priestleyi ULC007 TaxID=1920490 RepID=A0A2T1D9K6_9CYAN|nr:chloride channel protein [Phormidesmis priestleyi]PSB17123.1 CBS domain-containing protein [Phormidesmis priestleyi ULC007]PZO47469.1 MAG: CBS domain-containing protein [Phormidesmis priestleyi]
MWQTAFLKRLPRLLQPNQLAIFEACLIGLISGLAAVSLKQGAAAIAGWRLDLAHQYPVWVVLPIVGLVGGFLAGLLIERAAPEATGSGIPQVKAALGHVSIALNARVAIVKLFSTLLSLGSGLTLGRQGPTVQIGAAIAAQLSAWVPTSPEHRRQLIAAGAAAGLAAGFNAPIAGVLFVVEELLQDVSGLTLGTAILASFIGAVVSRLLGGGGLNVNMTGLYTSFSIAEIPLFIALGILAGLFGALFNRGVLLSLAFNRRSLKVGLPWRIGFAGLISGLAVAFLPAVLRDTASLQEVWLTSALGWKITALIFVTKFILTLIASGSGAPGGLFAPSLILGSALGYLVSTAAQHLQLMGIPLGVEFGEGLITTSALAGMGAFFSAVTRGPITAIVIVFEMTTNFNLVLPLMIGSVTAYLVAESIYGGSIYKHLLASNGIHLKPETAIDTRLAGLTAADIMQRHVETVSSQMRLDEAIQAFSRSHHRGFPVVDDGKLVGIVTQSDLTRIHERDLAGDLFLNLIMTPNPVTVSPTAPLSQVLYLLNRFKVSRLPVLERRKLLGIITRADIIRAESDQLSGEVKQVGIQPDPSYVVYQTRAPAVGKGRLLVPISNPQTAESLLQMAAAIARERHYELECLQVIPIARHQDPAETPVSTTISRRLLKRAARLGEEWQIPVHTQVRVTHDVAHAILEAVKDRHIDLLLMGWKGSTVTPGRVFGSVVDTIIRQASCDVVLIKNPNSAPAHPKLDRWLIPTAGGPNSRKAIQLLPAFARLTKQPEVFLCQVHQPERSRTDIEALKDAMVFLSNRLRCPVVLRSVCANSVSEAVVDLAQKDQCDVIVLGATREGLLQQVIKGNIPEEIARQCDCTVILVRGAIK